MIVAGSVCGSVCTPCPLPKRGSVPLPPPPTRSIWRVRAFSNDELPDVIRLVGQQRGDFDTSFLATTKVRESRGREELQKWRRGTACLALATAASVC